MTTTAIPSLRTRFLAALALPALMVACGGGHHASQPTTDGTTVQAVGPPPVQAETCGTEGGDLKPGDFEPGCATITIPVSK
jgi:hypothetical protein